MRRAATCSSRVEQSPKSAGEDREDLAAVDLTTGKVTAWKADPTAGPNPQSKVYVVSAAGRHLYVGGDFGGMGEQTRRYFAAFDLPVTAAIYPGDTNNDGVVDARDILPIGLYYGLTGSPRDTLSTAWGARDLMEAWPHPNENAAYADCNGDGTVDASDVTAIIENWHGRRGQPTAGSTDRPVACREILRTIDGQALSAALTKVRSAVVEYMTAMDDPPQLQLGANAPNPFRSSTTWSVSVQDPTPVRLEIFDPGGRLLWHATYPELAVGTTTLLWNGTDLRGRRVSTGAYEYKLTVGSRRTSGKAILIR